MFIIALSKITLMETPDIYAQEGLTENPEIEQPYFDEKGKEIKEFAVIKVFHFKGVNDQGRGRKNYYMYKWVRLKEWDGKKHWVAHHLCKEVGNDYYHLRTVAGEGRKIKGTEIVQSY